MRCCWHQHLFMPRATRLFRDGTPVHLVQRGHNGAACFTCDSDRRLYLQWLGEALAAEDCALHAHVLMTNHVHLLVTPARAQSLPRVMISLGRRYVRHVNEMNQRSGTLWEGRYKSSLVTADPYLLACYRYIELNPVRAGLVARPSTYRWSSHRANALGRDDPLLKPHPSHEALGTTEEAKLRAYRDLFDTHLEPQTVDAIRTALRRNLPLSAHMKLDP